MKANKHAVRPAGGNSKARHGPSGKAMVAMIMFGSAHTKVFIS